MPAGRPALPDNIKALKGTLKKHRINTRQPAAAYLKKPPPVPKEIKGIADKLWRSIGKRYTATRVLTDNHLSFMAHIAATMAEMLAIRDRLWQEDMQTGELVYTTTQEAVEQLVKANGERFVKTYRIPHPDVKHYSILKQEFRVSCAQFGMTPATSEKLIAQVDAGVEPDEFDPF